MLNFQQNGEKMQKYLKVLKKCPLFFGIDDSELLTLLSCLDAKVAEFDKKYTIIAEGNPAKYICVLLSGSAQISRTDYYGFRSMLSEIYASDIFGEAFACAELESVPVSVIANEPCVVMLIDRDRIMRTCNKGCGFHSQLIFNLMKDLAVKTLMFHQKIEVTSKRTTREKLMTYLMIQAKKAGSNSFTVPFDRQALADYLEVDRSGLSAEISRLRNENIVKSHKNYFEIL